MRKHFVPDMEWEQVCEVTEMFLMDTPILIDMSRQSVPSRDLSDSDPITPWEPKNHAGRKAYVVVYMLISMFPNFHIFCSMGTFLSRNINILPRWLIGPPVHLFLQVIRKQLFEHLDAVHTRTSSHRTHVFSIWLENLGVKRNCVNILQSHGIQALAKHCSRLSLPCGITC